MRTFALLVGLLGISVLPALGFYFAPSAPLTVNGTTYLPWQVVGYESGAYSVAFSLPVGTQIDSVYRTGAGTWLLSVGAAAVLGGTTYQPRDVFSFDGVSSYAPIFNGAAAGVPAGSNVDAVFRDGGAAGDLILSFDTPTTIGGSTFAPADLVRYSGGAFTLLFDASASTPPVPASSNVTGAGRVGNRIFLTFDVATTLGAVTILPGQAVSWDGSVFTPVFSDPSWPLTCPMSGLSVVPCADTDGDGYGTPGDITCPAGSAPDCNNANPAVAPGAPQACADGLNNNCSSPSWPSLAGTNEADDDGDTLSECAGDCLDTDPSAWGMPGEARDLRLSGTTINWTAPVTLGATPASIRYDIIRSTAASDFANGPFAACALSAGGPGTSSADTTMPAAGRALYYLVRARSGCLGALGIGPMGVTSAGVPRAARSCP